MKTLRTCVCLFQLFFLLFITPLNVWGSKKYRVAKNIIERDLGKTNYGQNSVALEHFINKPDYNALIQAIDRKGARLANQPDEFHFLVSCALACFSPDKLGDAVKRGLRLDAKGTYGPALHGLARALGVDFHEAVTELLKHGADPAIRVGRYNGNALHVAVSAGNAEVARALVLSDDSHLGVRLVNALDGTGRTPLDRAHPKIGNEWKSGRFMLTGTEVDQISAEQEKLRVAFRHLLTEGTPVKTTKKLIRESSFVKSGIERLDLIFRKKAAAVSSPTKLFYEQEWLMGFVPFGSKPVNLAYHNVAACAFACFSPEKLGDAIRQLSLDVNATDFHGRTALHLLAARGDLSTAVDLKQAAKALLDNGFKVQADHRGVTPIDIAEALGNKELAAVLRAAN